MNLNPRASRGEAGDDPRVQTVIAAEYGIGQMQVSRIKRRERWSYL